MGRAGREIWPLLWPKIGYRIEKAMQGLATWDVDQKIQEMYWTQSYLPALNDNGLITGVLITCSESTERMAMTKQLRRAKVQAESANFSKSAFLANMSHEIRTPLGAILGFTELLRDATTQKERVEYSRIIKRNGKALSTIIDDILDISKMEAGRLNVKTSAFRLDDLISDINEMFSETAKAKGVDLYFSFAPQTPKGIHSDPTRLRQILVNLVGNAVKFTDKGSVNLYVQPLVVKGALAKLKFIVSDTGCGMSELQKATLFEPFSQADCSSTRKFGGSGLGLALSRKLARALGGDIVLEGSEEGQGSTFAATVDAVAIAELTDDKYYRQRVVQEKHHYSHARVLLVEDSPDNQTLVSLILSKAGMQMDVANNGRVGVELAEKGVYDIILMDMQMPILDGYAASRQLRRAGYRKPIIALTAHALPEERSKVLAAGCDAHLTKPLDAELLIRTIESYHCHRSHG